MNREREGANFRVCSFVFKEGNSKNVPNYIIVKYEEYTRLFVANPWEVGILMRKFFRTHPILFAVFILVASRIVGMGAIYILNIFFPELDPIKDLGWLLQLLFATTSVALVYWSGDAKEVGFTKPVSKKEWLLWVPPLLIPLFIVLSFGFNVSDVSRAIVLTIAALCVAVNEETIFRGVLVKGFLRFGMLATLVVPSILFGLIHLGNIPGGGDILFGVFQVLWAIAGGVALTAMRLRNGSIYPVIIFHFIVDLSEYFATNEYGVHDLRFSPFTLVVFGLLCILFAIYALVALKKSHHIMVDSEMSMKS